MKRTIILLVLSVFIGLEVVAKPHKDTVQRTILDALEVKAKAGQRPYRASHPIEWDIIHTRLAISFNLREKTSPVRTWIKLHPHMYSTDSVVLDAKGVAIDSVVVVNKKTAVRQYTYSDNQLTIRFASAYKAQDTITIYIKYTAMPYANPTKGSAAIRDDRGLYFVNTDGQNPYRPAQIWTQGETEANSHWMITIDKPNFRFTTRLEMTVPDSFTTLSNGKLVQQQKQKGGLRTDVWEMNKSIAAYQVMMAIGKFSIVTEPSKEWDIKYYVEPEYKPYAAEIFQHTDEMLSFFSKKVGVRYPWNKYSQVVVRNYVSGAMENTSATLFGEFANQTSREMKDKKHEDVVSHELFHQWFGDHVTAESWSNLTLNESFANYGEQLWRRYKYGAQNANQLAYDDLQRYLNVSNFKDPEIVRFKYEDKEEMFDGITYNKGGAVLRYLNTIIGDDAFDRAMKIYQTKNALSAAETHHWRLAVEEATGQDMNWFFNQWYYLAGHPILKVTYDYQEAEQRLAVSVAQVQKDSPFAYRLPLVANICYGKETKPDQWLLTSRKHTFYYPYKNGEPPLVMPDAQHVLPGEVRDDKTQKEWLRYYQLSQDGVSKIIAIKAASKKPKNQSSLRIFEQGLEANEKSVKETALVYLRGLSSDSARQWLLPKVKKIALSDSTTTLRSQAIGLMRTWKMVDVAQMVPILQDASYQVAGTALAALADTNRQLAYKEAITLLKTNPRSKLDEAIWDVIGDVAADGDITLFEQHMPREQLVRQFYFQSALADYLKNVKADASFERGVKLYGTITKIETLNSYRSSLGNTLIELYQAMAEKEDTGSDTGRKYRLGQLNAAIQALVTGEQDPAIKEAWNKKWSKK
jgi:aminopeptidase N